MATFPMKSGTFSYVLPCNSMVMYDSGSAYIGGEYTMAVHSSSAARVSCQYCAVTQAHAEDGRCRSCGAPLPKGDR
jgi:uncharacterized paraquat-inducible protein A